MTSWRNALWTASFLALLVLGDRISAAGIGRLVLESELRFSRLYRGGVETDYLILGNSRGVNSFYVPDIERATGRRAFNLSYNGMSTVAMEAVLLDFLDRNESPRLALIEVSNLLGEDHLIKDLKPYAAVSPRLWQLLKRDAPRDARATQLSHLYAFNSDLLFRSLYYLHRSDQSWINRHQLREATRRRLAEFQPRTFESRGENVVALTRVLQELDSRKIPSRLIIAPYLPEYADRIENLERWVQRIAEELPGGAQLSDYSRALVDPSDFADATHVNRRGSARLLRRMLADRLLDLKAVGRGQDLLDPKKLERSDD